MTDEERIERLEQQIELVAVAIHSLCTGCAHLASVVAANAQGTDAEKAEAKAVVEGLIKQLEAGHFDA